VLLDVAAVTYTRRFLGLVLAAAEQGGYFGNWALAFGATGLTGLRGYSGTSILDVRRTARYDEDAYAQSTGATWAELNHSPGEVTRRLVGPLLRALAAEDRYGAALTDPAPQNLCSISSSE
jgi:hypothetical protein